MMEGFADTITAIKSSQGEADNENEGNKIPKISKNFNLYPAVQSCAVHTSDNNYFQTLILHVTVQFGTGDKEELKIGQINKISWSWAFLKYWRGIMPREGKAVWQDHRNLNFQLSASSCIFHLLYKLYKIMNHKVVRIEPSLTTQQFGYQTINISTVVKNTAGKYVLLCKLTVSVPDHVGSGTSI